MNPVAPAASARSTSSGKAGRECDDSRHPASRQLSDFSDRCISVHHGHLDIHEDHVEFLFQA